jgi:hypothetical protein
MSAQGRPLVHQVIPMIDKLTDKLGKAIDSDKIHITVRAGAIAGLAVLNKYYGKTDKSIIYRLAIRMFICLIHLCISNHILVMHPRLKFDYFKQHNWEPSWIDDVRTIAREHYNTHYKQVAPPGKPFNKVCTTVYSIFATHFNSTILLLPCRWYLTTRTSTLTLT